MGQVTVGAEGLRAEVEIKRAEDDDDDEMQVCWNPEAQRELANCVDFEGCEGHNWAADTDSQIDLIDLPYPTERERERERERRMDMKLIQ